MNMKLCITVFITFLSASCAAPFQVIEPDPETGRYPTRGVVDEEELLTNKAYEKISDIEYVYLRADSQFDKNGFENYMIESLKIIGFDTIYTEEGLTDYVISKGLADEVPSISDLLALNRLAKLDKPFLYINTDVNISYGCCWFKLNLTVYDSATGEKYLEITRDELNDMNLDREVLHPILNQIKDWREESLSQSN